MKVVRVALVASLLVATGSFSSIASDARAQGSATVPQTWRLYQNDRYGFTLSYPPDVAIVLPHNPLEPPPVFRVWFKDKNLVKSPLGDREPPLFAVDVYDNASGLSLDAWLARSGVVANLARAVVEAAVVGGQQGLRVTAQVMVAPNEYYFVARKTCVYRFTPLGASSDLILGSIRFIQ